MYQMLLGVADDVGLPWRAPSSGRWWSLWQPPFTHCCSRRIPQHCKGMMNAWSQSELVTMVALYHIENGGMLHRGRGGGLTPNFILAANIHKFQYKIVNTHGVATFWKNVKNWRKKKEMNCEIDLIGLSTVYYPY